MRSEPLGGSAATAAVRRAVLRSVAGLVVGAALFVAGGLLGSAIDGRRADLLADGVRVSGVVVGVVERGRLASGSVEVRFAVDGQDRVRSLALVVPDALPRVGDLITLFYDAAEPEQVASAQAGTEPPLVLAAAHLGAFVAAVGLTAAGAVLTGRWSRRLFAVRRHGWRSGTATADSGALRVNLDVAGVVVVEAHRAPARTGRVLLGGTTGAAVLVFADGRVVSGRELPGRVPD
ncbi:DUF3592 domain-containing protein [Actinokineospora cianjurensis]|uniref:DUF3592 domain-containing protein n=1 Tax=Actinokineospora cianjurensis TaxID=585224 RepID=A0A421B539_9PSEU|nr:DUF3592 domain-containing protein [Actinokineospora cianjurensis]RLK59459.1 hypothetical protein CLV68_3947 [Actinokineospora cianjurensis]